MNQRQRRHTPEDPTDSMVIEQRAVHLLSRREHSAQELIQKLIAKGFERQAVEDVVAKLEERRWQSDARFADVFFRQRVQQGYGPLRIRLELQHKGIDDAEIQRVFSAEAIDWFELAHTRLQQRFRASPEGTDQQKEQARRVRYLMQRGFTSEQAWFALKYLDKNHM